MKFYYVWVKALPTTEVQTQCSVEVRSVLQISIPVEWERVGRDERIYGGASIHLLIAVPKSGYPQGRNR